MKIIKMLVIAYLLLPFLGLFGFSEHQRTLYGNSYDLIYLYITHLIIIFYLFFLFIKILPKFIKSKYFKSTHCYRFEPVAIRCIFVLLFCILMMLLLGAGDIILGNIGRGEFRSSLGGVGFLYNFFIKFTPSICVALSSYIYLLNRDIKPKKYLLVVVYVLGALIGFLTGFKFTSILIVISGLIVLSPILKISYLLTISLIFLFLMTFSASYFMGFEYYAGIKYVFYRATSVAVEGTVGIFHLFPNGAEDAWMALLYGFGNNIASLISGIPVSSPEFLKINITRLIGYLTYPKWELALSGSFNLTVTNFGEAIYYFGSSLFWFFSAFTGIYLALFVSLYEKARINSNVIFVVLFSVYLSVVLFPWLMGGAVATTFSIPTIVYMFGSYFLMKLLLSNYRFLNLRFRVN